jgi:hypothetical protein
LKSRTVRTLVQTWPVISKHSNCFCPEARQVLMVEDKNTRVHKIMQQFMDSYGQKLLRLFSISHLRPTLDKGPGSNFLGTNLD